MSLSKDLEILRDAGFAVPENALTYALDQERRQQGIVAVWKCNCGYEYSSSIAILEFDHGCGKISHQTWPTRS